MDDLSARAALRRIFDAAIARAAPGPAVLRNLPEKPLGRCVVVGAGKAAAAMAAALDTAWPDVELTGVVVTRYGHAVPVGRITVLEAGHPVPDAASESAARRILAAVPGLSSDDLVLALISGGGSATMSLPIDGLSLGDKQAITRALLTSGAPIGQMNLVRKHLSQIKGGALLAAAAPARVVTLVISDVPGDDPAAVASGPTFTERSSPAEALAILDHYRISLPGRVRGALEGVTVRSLGDGRHEFRIIATPGQSLDAAAQAARDEGFEPVCLGDAIEGESREVAQAMAAQARTLAAGTTRSAPTVLLSGGETTVSIGPEGSGRGGRNTEFLLALALALDGAARIWAIAGDSDGIDGTEDAAGALVAPDTLGRAWAAGFDPAAVLARHDSYSLFAALRDLVTTGPTLTNVNDIRAIMVL